MTAPPEQLAYEAYQAVRWPYGEAGSTPWTHPALDKARPAWKAAVAAGVDASPDLATARNALSDLAELHLRTVEELAAVTAALGKARADRDAVRGRILALGAGLEAEAAKLTAPRLKWRAGLRTEIAGRIRKALDS